MSVLFRYGLWLALFGVGLSAQQAHPGCALDKAIALHQAGDLEAAAREYRACVAADPGRVEIRSNLGVVLAGLGRYQEAIDQYRAAIKLASPEIAQRLRFNLALAYYKSSQIPDAAGELEALHSANPDDVRIALLLGDCDLQTGRFPEAIALLTPLTAPPDEQDALDYVLGMALIRSGRATEGEVHVDRILRRGDSAEGHFLLGSALFMDANYPGAVQEFAKAIALNPNVPSLQSYYGRALLFTGDADGAAAAFRNELALNPNDFDANFQLAAILSQRGKAAEARPLLERAVELRPGSAEARAALEHGFSSSHSADAGVLLGAPAPAIASLDLAHLPKPMVLVFGSYTCPKLRFSAADLKRAWGEFHDRVDFRLVYIREAHAEGNWQSTINQKEGVDLQPAHTLAEKQAHAALCLRKLSLPFGSVVDGMDGAAEKAYNAWPSRVYLVSRDGRVAFDSRLGEQDFRAADFEAAIREILAERGTHGPAR
jgi:tetratricopeptide (TPR) repeat protein